MARSPRERDSAPPVDDGQLDLPLRPPARSVVTTREVEADPPFLRPQKRTRVQKPRRGALARSIVALNVLAVVSLASVVLWRGYARVMASDRLKVARLDVRGGHFLSEGEVRELLGPAVGENILTLDIESLKQRLRASPWVEGADVQRTLPDTIRVDIEERQPIALAEIDRLYLMDAAGSLIEMYGPRTATFDLPIVRGLGGLGLDERRDRARQVAGLLSDLGDLAAELSEVNATPEGLEAVLRGGDVVRLGTSPFRKKFTTFLGLRAALHERCPEAEFFDLRFRDRIYVQERTGTMVPAVTPDAVRGR